MATNYLPSSSETYSLNGGKYRIKVASSFSTDSIVWTASVVVTNAFDSNMTLTVTYKDANGNEKTLTKKSIKSKTTYTLSSVSYKGQKVPKISFKLAGNSKSKTVSLSAGTIQYVSKSPMSPSYINVVRNNDAQMSISVNFTSYTTIPTNKIEIERCVDVYDTNAFSPIPSSPFTVTGTTYLSAIDNSSEIERGHKYWYRARAYNTLSDKSSAWIYSSAVATTANNDSLSGSLNVTRVNNNRVNISWDISSVSFVNNGLVSSFDIYRSTNGGAFLYIGSVRATTISTAYNFVDTSCSSGNYYSYAIRCNGEGGTAETKISSDTVIYMTPNPPQSVSVARNSNDDVIVSITNYSNTATKVYIERSLDGGAFTQIAEEDYPIATYTDPSVQAGRTIVYRVRNYTDQLSGSDAYSDYRTSLEVSTISRPNPPSLVKPDADSYIALDEGSVELAWRHNSTDGSAQERAVLQYRKNGGSWVTITRTTQPNYILDISSYSPNDVVEWHVKTKGAYSEGTDNGYSEYSDIRSFSIKAKPNLIFTSPMNGDVISELPIVLEWEYEDLSGTLESLTVAVIKDYVVQKTFNVPIGDGTSGSYSYSLAGFLFDNEANYSIRANALSSSGLDAVSDLSLFISYEPIALEGGLLINSQTDEDGIAYITIVRDITLDEETEEPYPPVDIADAYLYRVYKNQRELIQAHVQEGFSIADKFAPLNIEFDYELLMITLDGRVSIFRLANTIQSDYSLIYFGEKTARARWNPEFSGTFKRPEKKRVPYSGREYPVSYDSKAKERTNDFSFVIVERDDFDRFLELIDDGGQGIWKSADGEVYYADFEFTWNTNRFKKTQVWNCNLSVVRIERDI